MTRKVTAMEWVIFTAQSVIKAVRLLGERYYVTFAWCQCHGNSSCRLSVWLWRPWTSLRGLNCSLFLPEKWHVITDTLIVFVTYLLLTVVRHSTVTFAYLTCWWACSTVCHAAHAVPVCGGGECRRESLFTQRDQQVDRHLKLTTLGRISAQSPQQTYCV